MIFRIRRATFAIMLGGLLLASAQGCDGCKKAKESADKVKKEVVAQIRKIDEAPAPADLVGEAIVKDPETVAKRAIDGAGYGPDVGPSPWKRVVDSVTDENAKKALSAIDPHSPMMIGLLMRFDLANLDKPHVVVAAKLKDPEVTATELSAGAAAGKLKSWTSKVLDATVYEPKPNLQVVVYGSEVVVADTRESLEDGAKYAAFRASTADKLEHDCVVHVPMDKVGPSLNKLGLMGWAMVPSTAVPSGLRTVLDTLVPDLLAGIGDMGDLTIDFDVDATTLKSESKLLAKGTFAGWLGRFPSGDSSALLSLPQADSATLLRIPDGLGPLTYAGIDAWLATTTMSTTDRADLEKQMMALGKSLGHEWSLANKGAAMGTEMFMRLELSDAPAAKGAMAALEKQLVVLGAALGKPKLTPYKKFGAEGEELDYAFPGAPPVGLLWAVRAPYLYVDFATGPLVLAEAGIDPASKSTLASDAVAKGTIGGFPSKGIIGATYGAKGFLPPMLAKMMAPAPATSAPSSPMWSWTTASSSALEGKGEIPLSFVGDLARVYLAATSLGRKGGAPMGY